MLTMNREEKLAKAHLESMQGEKVVFEPLGETTIPDFGLDDRIGVEVRRLNENYFGGEQIEGLEQVDLPVWKALNEAIKDFEGKPSQRSYWVMIEFERPLGRKGKRLRGDIKRSLAAALQTNLHKQSGTALNIRNGLRLWLYPSTVSTNNPFRVGGISDMDSGGAVAQMYVHNIEYCIAEKSRKGLPVQDEFEEWWLLLVDTLTYELADYEMDRVNQSVTDLGIFTRVTLINSHTRTPLLDLRDGPAQSAA